MTVGALIAILRNADQDSQVRVYADADEKRCPRVIGVDNYERVAMLVLDTDE